MLISIYKLEDADGQPLCSFENGEHVIGRGKELQCQDKRVSRKHLQFIITNGSATMTAKHEVNPCFYTASGGKHISILRYNNPTEINDGDKFGFFPDQYWFVIKIAPDNNDNLDINRTNNGCENVLSNIEHPDELNGTADDLNVSEEENRVAEDLNTTAEESYIDVNRTVVDFNTTVEEIPNVNIVNPAVTEINSTRVTEVSLNFTDEKSSVILEEDGAATSEENQTLTSEENCPSTPGENQALTSEENQPLTPEKNQPLTSGVNKKSRSGENQPSTSGENQPATSGENKPSTSGENQPSTSGENQPQDPTVPTIQPDSLEFSLTKVKHEADTQDETYAANNIVDPSQLVKTEIKDEPDDASQNAPSRTYRDRCWYGPRCYRKNAEHKRRFAHSTDADYDTDPEDERPQCPFGYACYRRNKEHRKDYKHSRFELGCAQNKPTGTPDGAAGSTNNPQRPKKTRKRKKKTGNDEDESQGINPSNIVNAKRQKANIDFFESQASLDFKEPFEDDSEEDYEWSDDPEDEDDSDD